MADDGGERLARQRERLASHKLQPPLAEQFDSSVVGVTFVDGYPWNLYQLEEVWLQRRAEERLPAVLIRNPENEHDSNAIEVHAPALGEKIGHLPRHLAAKLAPRLDAGETWQAEFNNVAVGANVQNPGITVRVWHVHTDPQEEP